MRTFAQKKGPIQYTKSGNSARSSRAFSHQSREVHSTLHLQRTIGNQAVQRLTQSKTEDLETASLAGVSSRFVHGFSRIPWRAEIRAEIQPNITVSTPGDTYEQEADRVADQVMRMPEPQLQHACVCGGGCPKCRKVQGDHERLQTKPRQRGDAGKAIATPIIDQGRASPGQPLDASTREFFEPRFRHDLSNVRVHRDAEAQRTAAAFAARAFAVGNHIWLGSGESNSNRALIAHELAHVVQQSGPREGAKDTSAPRLTALGRPALQRRVVNSRVSCRNTGLHGGVPGGTLTGAQAIATLQAADREAIRQGRRAENLLFLQRLTFGTTLYHADPTFDAALTNRFGLNLANPADHARIAIIEREYKAVNDFMQSGALRYTCRGSTCAGDDWAFAMVPGNRLFLCNLFWNSPSVALQGSTLLHESFHLWWDQVNDAGPPMHNAHCFEQFALDLAGVAVPAAFAGGCVV